jgi:hypothetical protein
VTGIVEVGPIPVELVEIDRLSIDKRYQRELNTRFVEQIATRWDWRLCGVIHVNQRNGRMLVVDGQHRVEAAKIAGVAALPCLLMNEVANVEPRVFVELQQRRRSVRSSEWHTALLAAKDETALDVAAALGEAGCKISNSASRTSTTAAKACYDIYARGGAQLLTDVFMVCRRSWPFARLPQTNFLLGLGVFLSTQFRHDVDLERLAEHLAVTTPQAITVAARSFNSTAAINVAREIVSIYNRSIDGGRTGRASLDSDAVQQRGKRKAS